MKQEILEEAAEKYVNSFEFGIAHPRRVCKNAFINGAKWQQEISYSEDDLEEAFKSGFTNCYNHHNITFGEWFEQFKNK